jgi:hypothetical protein
MRIRTFTQCGFFVQTTTFGSDFTKTTPAGIIFSISCPNRIKNSMDLLIIIFAFLLAYGIFVLIAVKLARIFFPKIVDDGGMDLKPRSDRQRHPKRATI